MLLGLQGSLVSPLPIRRPSSNIEGQKVGTLNKNQRCFDASVYDIDFDQ
jgi:hypothetical protein